MPADTPTPREDAERLATIKAKIAHWPNERILMQSNMQAEANLCFVLRLLNARDAALREKDAEIADLLRERDDLKSDYLRVHKDKCDLMDFLVAKGLWVEWHDARPQPAADPQERDCFGDSAMHASTHAQVGSDRRHCDLCGRPIPRDATDVLTAVNTAPTPSSADVERAREDSTEAKAAGYAQGVEDAAQRAERYEPQHEANTVIARTVAKNIAASIRALSAGQERKQ